MEEGGVIGGGGGSKYKKYYAIYEYLCQENSFKELHVVYNTQKVLIPHQTDRREGGGGQDHDFSFLHTGDCWVRNENEAKVDDLISACSLTSLSINYTKANIFGFPKLFS